MGTYRTNKALAYAAYKIEDIYYDPKEGKVVKLSNTDYTEFGSPVHVEHKWTLGEINEKAQDGEEIDIEEFKDIPLYKVVQRDGEWFLMFIKLVEGSKVYKGAFSGSGIYFETDIDEALMYKDTNNDGISLDWEDDPELNNKLKDIKAEEAKKDFVCVR